MGEEKKIVVEHFPVAELPERLRHGFDAAARVRVTIEPDAALEQPAIPLTSFIGAGKGVYGSPEDAVAAIRALRDEWEK